jgi:hypothetical protein
MNTAVTITKEQRDLLHQGLAVEINVAAQALAGEINPIYFEGPAELEEAQRTRRRIEHDCRLLDELGWTREDDRAEFVLTLPKDVIEPIVQRVLDDAESELRQANSAIAQELAEQNKGSWQRIVDEALDIGSACRDVLSQLEVR